MTSTRDPIKFKDDISITSSAMSCTQRPSNLTVSNISSNSAEVSWTASSPVPASGYDYYYTTVQLLLPSLQYLQEIQVLIL